MAIEQSNESLSGLDTLPPGHHLSLVSASRPTSAYTIHSTFADSAVDMDTPTPTALRDLPGTEKGGDYFKSAIPLATPNVDQTLSDKMRQLAAVAWTLEQDDSMGATKRNRIKKMLAELETHLDSGDAEVPESATAKELSQSKTSFGNITDPHSVEVAEGELDEDEEWIDESELIAVRNNLSATVKSMRLRFEEQRHLHQLTTSKLEAVAQKCIAQAQQVQDLLDELKNLRQENHTLGAENDQLRDKAAGLEFEATRNEVAVHAMSSAVTGLEGWIDSTNPSRHQTPLPAKKAKRQKVVIRGKGRFRGRYFVDEDDSEAGWYTQALADSELHQGVKAWLRGFHDVEEELRQQDSSSQHHSQVHRSETQDDVEWSDFQDAED
ncbi:hypothetical protein H2198_009552 [Neophaeococcomyces mojaviensis]|uniref:Uncharacterized protein n=1 Tax=Neophaeococcomyces mojaviensis TaxID=3383035 RepID=A0ACC2ZUC7_9EURO|nr:hypothetical protein H2198_009552 [Knufia sp. JES_112]